jgi:hypothetical protein
MAVEPTALVGTRTVVVELTPFEDQTDGKVRTSLKHGRGMEGCVLKEHVVGQLEGDPRDRYSAVRQDLSCKGII